MPRNYVLFALALPLCAIVLGIVRAELHLAHGRDFVFEVEGFDPRDLLRGHYLQFRLRIDEGPAREACSPTTESCCLCLTELGAGVPPRAEPATCETARLHCDGALQMRHVTRAHRYYVPEAQAAKLEKRLFEAIAAREAHVVLALDAEGEPAIRQLRLFGKPIVGAK